MKEYMNGFPNESPLVLKSSLSKLLRGGINAEKIVPRSV
jgi:hypothetical protein